MQFIVWLALGLVVGLLPSRVSNRAGERISPNLGSAAIGAMIGGFLFDQFGDQGASHEMVCALGAAAGAASMLLVYRLGLRPCLKALDMSLQFVAANSTAEG